MKLPYWPLYAGDFIGETITLTAEQQGYLLLMRTYLWISPRLPADVNELAKILRADQKALSRAWPQIRGYFSEQDGFLVDDELAETRAKQVRSRQRMADGGKNKPTSSQQDQAPW